MAVNEDDSFTTMLRIIKEDLKMMPHKRVRLLLVNKVMKATCKESGQFLRRIWKSGIEGLMLFFDEKLFTSEAKHISQNVRVLVPQAGSIPIEVHGILRKQKLATVMVRAWTGVMGRRCSSWTSY